MSVPERFEVVIRSFVAFARELLVQRLEEFILGRGSFELLEIAGY